MKELINSVLKDMVENDETNRVVDAATGCTVTRMDMPLVGYADVEDEIFRQMKNPDYIGAHYHDPKDFLESARTVVSVFFPLSEEVRKSNRAAGDPSDLWMTCSGTNRDFMRKTMERVVEELARALVWTQG